MKVIERKNIIKTGFLATVGALNKSLGKTACHEDYYEIALLMAASVVTANNALSHDEIMHNYKCFIVDLMDALPDDKPIDHQKTTSRLM